MYLFTSFSNQGAIVRTYGRVLAGVWPLNFREVQLEALWKQALVT